MHRLTPPTRPDTRPDTRPVWGREALRLDPYAGAQALAFRDADHEVEVALSPRGAVMKRRLSCGVDLKLALPAQGFEGVAARAFENEDGTCTITLTLRHADPALSVPLMATDDPQEAAADWRSWARNLRLPMLLDGVNGLTRVEDGAALVEATPLPRRRRRTTLKHRPNFMRRRAMGRVGTVQRVSAREIIART